MSGGSYNYLAFKSGADLLGGSGDYDLEAMADRLAGLGYAADAAKETISLLLTIRAARNRIEVSVERLTRVWKAVEWWDSADYGEGDVKEALEQYRDPEPKRD
jgi:hypothetical protein